MMLSSRTLCLVGVSSLKVTVNLLSFSWKIMAVNYLLFSCEKSCRHTSLVIPFKATILVQLQHCFMTFSYLETIQSEVNQTTDSCKWLQPYVPYNYLFIIKFSRPDNFQPQVLVVDLIEIELKLKFLNQTAYRIAT